MTTAREEAEQELRSKADFKPKLVLEGGAIHTYSPVKGKKNKDGDEVEDPMIGITFRVPVDLAVRYIGIITRLWRADTTVSIGLSFTEPAEQRKLGLDHASQNGSGPAPTGLEPIKEAMHMAETEKDPGDQEEKKPDEGTGTEDKDQQPAGGEDKGA